MAIGLVVNQTSAPINLTRTYAKGESLAYRFTISMNAKSGQIKQEGRFIFKVQTVGTDLSAEADLTQLPTQKVAETEGGDEQAPVRLTFDAYGMPKSMNRLTPMPVLLFGFSNLVPNRTLMKGESYSFSYQFSSMPIRVECKCRYEGRNTKSGVALEVLSYDFEIFADKQLQGTAHLNSWLNPGTCALENSELKLYEAGKESGSVTLNRLHGK